MVAREQFILKPEEFWFGVSEGNAQPQEAAGNMVFPIRNGSVTIDPTGALTSWIADGQQMLQAPLEPYFWKPENDNQHAAHFAERTAAWRDAAENRTVKSVRVEGNQVIADLTLSVGADLTLTYTVKNDGRIMVDMDYRPTATDIPLIPKFGMRMRLPADMTHIAYYGRGPWENYPDRKRSAFIGRYEMPHRTMATAVTYVGSKSVLRNKQYTLLASSHSASVPGTMEKKIWRELVTRKILPEDVLST